MMSIVVDYRKHVKENTLYAYNQKITRLKSRLRNVSSNQSVIDANSLEEKLNDVASTNQHELHRRYWSTNDILSYECTSNKNPSWCHSKHTEYRRANLDDRLGVHLNSKKFSWSQSESWLIVQNTIIMLFFVNKIKISTKQ
uniref:Hypotheticial protein n=1 Tax=Schistosoma japonicum TaxID=6182 RepID=C1L3R3_SCHJA|nr:hypotheticial protein [Schistosoma japonicum]